MPTHKVNRTPELDSFTASKVEAELCSTASKVMRSDPRLLEGDERECEEKLTMLRSAIDRGMASGIAEPGVFSRVRRNYKLPVREA
jgi:hypothetical protein